MLSRGDLMSAVSRRLRVPVADVLLWSADEIRRSTGKATAAVFRVQGEAGTKEGHFVPRDLTVKRPRAPASGDDDADQPGHCSYWRREALAYESALLPQQEDGLNRVECYGVFPDEHTGGLAVALQTVKPDALWGLDQFRLAAAFLGRWEAGGIDCLPQIEWPALDRLRQRIARTDAAGGLLEPDRGRQPLADSFREDVRGAASNRLGFSMVSAGPVGDRSSKR